MRLVCRAANAGSLASSVRVTADPAQSRERVEKGLEGEMDQNKGP